MYWFSVNMKYMATCFDEGLFTFRAVRDIKLKLQLPTYFYGYFEIFIDHINTH
jgi:hypothetical protein